MKPNSQINYFFILTFIAGVIVGALTFSSCTKPDERNDFVCKQYVKSSAPGYLPQFDTINVPVQLAKTNDEIIQYMNDFTGTKTTWNEQHQAYLTQELKMTCHALRIEVCPK